MAVIDLVLPVSSDSYLVTEPVLYETDGLKFGIDHVKVMSIATGYEERRRLCAENRVSAVFTWNCPTFASKASILKFYYDQQGQVSPFWMPTWIHTFELRNGVSSASVGVWMQSNAFCEVYSNSTYQRYGIASEALFIKLRNGSVYARPIAQCYTEALLYLTEPFPVDIDYLDIVMACRMYKWNFSSSIVEQLVGTEIGAKRYETACTLKASVTRTSCIEADKGISYYA